MNTQKISRRTWLFWAAGLVAALAIGFHSTANAKNTTASLAPFVRCFETVSHRNAPGSGRGIVVMIGSRIGSHGLYAFNASNAYYQPVPFASGYQIIQEQLPYMYEVEISGHPKIFVQYEPVNTVHEIPTPKDRSDFRAFNRRGLGVLDYQFRETLDRDLAARTHAWVARFRKATALLSVKRRQGVAKEQFTKLRRCYRKMPDRSDNRNARRALRNAIQEVRQVALRTKPVAASLGFPWPPKAPKEILLPLFPLDINGSSK